MKKKLLSLVLLLSVSIAFSQELDSIPEKAVNFMVIEKVPVYDGCGTYETNALQKQCFSEKIINHIKKYYDYEIIKTLGVPEGRYRVYVKFVIDKEGNVVDVEGSGSNYSNLNKEAERIVKLIPKFESPGLQMGKPVRVNYMLPIQFRVEK